MCRNERKKKIAQLQLKPWKTNLKHFNYTFKNLDETISCHTFFTVKTLQIEDYKIVHSFSFDVEKNWTFHKNSR